MWWTTCAPFVSGDSSYIPLSTVPSSIVAVVSSTSLVMRDLYTVMVMMQFYRDSSELL